MTCGAAELRVWIRAAGACGVPKPLAREPTGLQRTSADGRVKHADEFWGGGSTRGCCATTGVTLAVQLRYAANIWAPNANEEEDVMLGINFWAVYFLESLLFSVVALGSSCGQDGASGSCQCLPPP